MEVYQRKGSPNWYVDLVDPRTNQRTRQSLRCKKSRAEAQRKAAELYTKLKFEADTHGVGKSRIALVDAINLYMLKCKATNVQSYDRYRCLRDKLVGGGNFGDKFHLNAHMWIDELEPSHLEELAINRAIEGASSGYIRNELKFLRQAVRYACNVRGKRGPPVLLTGVVKEAWRLPKDVEKTRYLTVEEFQKLYDHLDPKRLVTRRHVSGKSTQPFALPPRHQFLRQETQDLCVGLAMTGCRYGEVCGLKWTAVDTAALQRWASWDPSVGTGDRPTVPLQIWQEKTKSPRLACAPDQLCEVLWRRWNAPNRSEWVFPNPQAPRERRKGTCRPLSEAMDKCGFNDPETVSRHGRATIHSLRHTFASMLVQNGASLKEVQEALGHATILQTQRYAHLSQTATAERAGKIMSSLPMGTKGTPPS